MMEESGIEELLEEVFASDVVHHILSGKAYAGAIRGLFLIHPALQTLIFDELLDSGVINEEEIR